MNPAAPTPNAVDMLRSVSSPLGCPPISRAGFAVLGDVPFRTQTVLSSDGFAKSMAMLPA